MRTPPIVARSLLLTAVSLITTAVPARAGGAIAVAWNDARTSAGAVAVLSARPPWQLVTPPIAVGRDAVLHDAGRTLYATSPSDGTITAIDVRCWRVLRVLRPDRGYLTFSTDLLLSSHLVQFTRSGEVGPQLHVSLDYFAPALAHDRATDRLFVPEVLGETVGVQVFDAGSGRQLSTVATPTGGPPADLLTLAKRPHARGCAAIDPPISPPGTSDGPPRLAHLPGSGARDG